MKGFTIVELMIIVIIIGIFALIAMPLFTGNKIGGGSFFDPTEVCKDGVIYFRKNMTPKYDQYGRIQTC